MSGRYGGGGGGGGGGGYRGGDEGRGPPRGRGGGYRGGGRNNNPEFHPYSRNSGPPRFHNGPHPRDLPANPVVQNAGAKHREFVIRLGEQSGFKTEEDMPRLSKLLCDQWAYTSSSILEGFTYGIIEEPHKLPLYAALLLCLSRAAYAFPVVVEAEDTIDAALVGGDEADEAEGDGDGDAEGEKAGDAEMSGMEAAVGDAKMDAEASGEGQKLEEKKKFGKRLHVAVIEELEKKLAEWIEAKEWRNARIMIQLFAHLTSLSLVTSTSYLSLLNTFASPLSSPTTSPRRAEHLVRIIIDSLPRAGPTFYAGNKEEVDEIIQRVEGFVDREVKGKGKGKGGRRLLHGSGLLTVSSDEEDGEDFELLETFLLALENARDTGFQTPGFLIPEYERVLTPEGEDAPVPINITGVTLPKETETEEAQETWICSMTANEQQIGTTDARVPDPRAPEGFCMISLLVDIIDIFEINRVECARILLTTLEDYLEPDTFRPAPPRPSADSEPPAWTPGYWVLYSTITSVIVSCLLRLPQSDHKHVYYMALIRELCALQPSNMAPPVGLAARRLYEKMGTGQGLDIALAGRLAEWLSGHLSNFAFAWMWQAWSADLHLPKTHPRRYFMHRVIEQEIRLAYYDRIMGSLPNAMKDEKDVPMLLDPVPVYPYDLPSHPLYDQAASLSAKMRERTREDGYKTEEVLPLLRELASTAVDESIPYDYRELASACILSVGARSFSHFLNATERYREILLAITTTGKERRDLVQFAGDFWQNDVQLLAVTYDKYINNGLIDAEDIVPYVFGKMSAVPEGSAPDAPTAWTNGHAWDILRMLLDKVKGRLEGRRRMTAGVEAEYAASQGNGIEVDDAELPDVLVVARMLLDRRQREHDNTCLAITQSFVQSFVGGTVDGVENATQSKASLGEAIGVASIEDIKNPALWDGLARFGWYKEFCRTYPSSLRTIKKAANPDTFDKLSRPTGEGQSSSTTGALLRAVWDEATA